MQDKNSSTQPDNQGPGGDSEATSKEQLSDLEENEAELPSSSTSADPEPSPDGAFDESDEARDAGPM